MRSAVFILMKRLIDKQVFIRYLRPDWPVLLVLILAASSALSGDAELTNLIIRSSNDQLQVDLTIKGIFTKEMEIAVSKGVPVSLMFLILLYETRDYWFDNKIVSKTAVHGIKFDVLKKEYRVSRSWEKSIPLVIKDFGEALYLFSELKGFDVISRNKLKKGKHYQLRVKSELGENKIPFTGFSWQSETDWYSINFVY